MIPEGFHSLTPYLTFDDANAAFEYYQRAFGAIAVRADRTEAGLLRHGELRLGNSIFMLTNTNPAYPFMKSPSDLGGSPMQVFVYCEDADALFAQAVAHGAKVVLPMADQSYGRSGGVEDPFGYIWWLTTHRS